MPFWQRKEKISLQGVMPERALLKLRRAGIDLFDIRKTQKNELVFVINKKDMQKVFAIYPNVCYNKSGTTPYTAKHIGSVGLGKYLAFAAQRTGFLLGALAFLGGTLYVDTFVFGVQFVGSATYAREARATLKEFGIKPFARYQGGNEDLICSKLLALDGVEFCSVKKNGLWVRVEMRLGEYGVKKLQSGNLYAAHTGEVIAITALRGTPLKAKGDSVQAGEPLVGGWFLKGEGEQVCVEPIARASIACAYEAEIAAETQDEAFATAYLALALDENATVQKTQITQLETGFLVRIEYIAIESINF